jgi:hypothetical protein
MTAARQIALSESSAGRIMLHLVCFVTRREGWRRAAAGIIREVTR